MRDFTTIAYNELIKSLLESNYVCTTYLDFIENRNKRPKIAILRHDVDNKPFNALKLAQLEHRIGVRSSYYFRIVMKSYNQDVIKEIVKLGHEIGYHYEDLALAKGKFEVAIKTFNTNLNLFRKLFPVKTICMHGSPLSKLDNRLIWHKYNYQDFGIKGEPYFDINFKKLLYLTDTGRRWNGTKTNIKDNVISNLNYNLKTTYDIISALNNNKLPDQIMINSHHQMWNDNMVLWFK